jgi:hypothetical protein
VLRRAQDRQVGRRHDAMSGCSIDERRVWHLDADHVAPADRVDVREGREVRRPVSRDVDEPVLAWHEAAKVTARPLFQRLVVGAVHDHHPQSDAADRDAADRLAARCLEAEASGVRGDRAAFRGEVAPVEADRAVGRELAIDALRELVLFPVRIEPGDRVLPPPDGHHPGEPQDTGDDQHRPERSRDPSHLSRVTRGAAPRVRPLFRPACGVAPARGGEPSREAARAAAVPPQPGKAHTGRP